MSKPTTLLDLSSELLEDIAFHLNTKECLHFGLACKRLSAIALQVAAPFYHTFRPYGFAGNIRRLADRLASRPIIGLWIREYDLGYGDEPYGQDLYTQAYNIGQATMLLRRMQKLEILWNRCLPSELDNSFGDSVVRDVCQVKSLKEITLHEWSASHVSQLFSLPVLRSISLVGMDLRAAAWTPNASKVISQSVTDLYMDCTGADLDGLATLFCALPALQYLEIDEMVGIDITGIVGLVMRFFPQIVQLDLSISSDEEYPKVVPSQWPSHLPALQTITLRNAGISDTSLLYFGPAISKIDLRGSHLSIPSLAYAIMQWRDDPALCHRRLVVLDDIGDADMRARILVSYFFDSS